MITQDLKTQKVYRVEAQWVEALCQKWVIGLKIGLELEADKPKGTIAFTGARIITMKGDEVIEDGGRITELKCTYFPDSRSGQDTSGLKPNGVIHWVAAEGAVPIKVNAYERLFRVPDPTADSFLEDIDHSSLQRYIKAWLKFGQ